MKMEDFTLRQNENNIEYLTFAEGITKTRQKKWVARESKIL